MLEDGDGTIRIETLLKEFKENTKKRFELIEKDLNELKKMINLSISL